MHDLIGLSRIYHKIACLVYAKQTLSCSPYSWTFALTDTSRKGHLSLADTESWFQPHTDTEFLTYLNVIPVVSAYGKFDCILTMNFVLHSGF